MSAGLIGVASARSRTDPDGKEGEIECVCKLFKVSDCSRSVHWRWDENSTYERTSDGSPYFE
jgi:hypothetical protein